MKNSKKHTSKKLGNRIRTTKIQSGLLLVGVAGLLSKTQGADLPKTASASTDWQKPVWLTDLSAGVKEGYDDNVLLVSGDGMKPQSSWISTLSPKLGFNFAPLLGDQQTLQTLSLTYAPELAFYHEAPSENYTANRINNVIKAKAGDLTFGLDNAFLDNDGSRDAPTYAFSQSTPASNQNDKFRNFYAAAVPRERRDQIQDRATTLWQYDWNNCFVRPTAALTFYGLDTYLHNTGAVPYKGYQDYVNRYDANGGMDLGYKVTPDLAVTLGYRYGSQHQQQFAPAISSDSHFSSSDYQRVLLGLEGKPWNWLKVKLAGGPDFRDYNPDAPVNDPHMTTYYGEAAVTATISEDQSVTFNYKQWQFVSAYGFVPYFDTTYALTYHWKATKDLGVDLGGKILEADFTSGNDDAGAAPSERDDRQYTVSTGLTYSFNDHVSASLTYAYDLGASELNNLSANLGPGYRNFEHQLVSAGLQYKF
jgi:opacity protein-like surface antigen